MKKMLVCMSAVIFALVVMTSFSFGAEAKPPKPRKPGVYAVFDTTMGTFACELYDKVAPETVANLVG